MNRMSSNTSSVRQILAEELSMNRLEQLEWAFDDADEYVVTHTQWPSVAQISNGWSDIWPKAVWHKAKFVNIREKFGYYYVEFEGVGYDSDHGIGNRFDPGFHLALQMD